MVLYFKNGEPHFDDELLNFVMKGDITVLQSFVQKDNSHVTDHSGNTLLHYAAEYNNVSMTQYFIDKKYDLDSLNEDGNTPVMLAIRRGSIETAKLLIEADANIYLRNSEGKSIIPEKWNFLLETNPLLLYEMDKCKVLSKYREIIKSILTKITKDFWNDKQLLLSKLSDIDCSIINVIYLRNSKVTRLMLENGYPVNEHELKTENTPLHEAVKLGDYENVKVLLKYGADVHALNKKGLSPIYSYNGDHLKGIGERVQVLEILIEHGALSFLPHSRIAPSVFIMATGKLWALNTLIKYDFEWDSYYSLYELVVNHEPDALEIVRGKSLDFNSIDNPLKSPVLSLATMFGKLKKVKFLLESGADPNAIGEREYTPFTSTFRYLFRLEKGHLPIVRLMLLYGADAQTSTQDGRTVFDIAIKHQQPALLDPVIAHLAITESIDHPINDLIRSKINSQETFKTQFEKYKQQLETMKNMVIYDSLSLYKLLTECQLKITRYANNRQFAQKFKQKMKIERRSLDPYYLLSLRKRVGTAIKVARLRREAVIVMNKIIKCRIKNYHEILSEIFDYLNCVDLKNLCKVSDFEETESFNLDTLFGV